ncbi:MAG TPA: purine-nucleoside phosphorylase [Chloroflexota bacterium]|nr:purine-nucleoside phosphorylase [Chloroflexota bacterium]
METAHAVRGWTALAPHVGIVLGSGLGPIADRVENAVRISTASLPHFPRSTVAGHAGELVVGLLSGRPVAVLSGRVHGYEGYSGAQIAFPVRLLHALGCRDVIVTNAAGALNPGFAPGEVMILDDHLSLPSLAGLSPLVGEASSASRPRFVDLTNAYAPALRQIAERAAEEARIEVRHGVYVMVGGPNFETPAEVCFLRAAGGDAVGMSTVPEVIVARQLGMRVLGLSVISNRAAGLPGASLTHDDVLATVARAVPAVARIIDGVLVRLAT